MIKQRNWSDSSKVTNCCSMEIFCILSDLGQMSKFVRKKIKSVELVEMQWAVDRLFEKVQNIKGLFTATRKKNYTEGINLYAECWVNLNGKRHWLFYCTPNLPKANLLALTGPYSHIHALICLLDQTWLMQLDKKQFLHMVTFV